MHKSLYRIVISFDPLKLPVNPVLEGIIFSPTMKCKDIVEIKILLYKHNPLNSREKGQMFQSNATNAIRKEGFSPLF